MAITKHNYHTPENKYISNSRIKLFVQSKEMYKKRYVDLQPQDLSKSLKIGQMVDCAFETGNIETMLNDFPIKYKRTCTEKKDPDQYAFETEELKGMVTPAEQAEAFGMANKILGSELYQWYKKKGMRRYFQKVVHDDILCGMLDVLVVDDENKICYIDDLKTSTPSDMASPIRWYWKCMKYGYFNQMVVYKHFIQKKYPDYEVICRHMVIGSAEPNEIQLYIIDPELIDNKINWMYDMAERIKNEKEWVDHIPTWDEAIILNNSIGFDEK